jgi:hypothetical protein
VHLCTVNPDGGALHMCTRIISSGWQRFHKNYSREIPGKSVSVFKHARILRMFVSNMRRICACLDLKGLIRILRNFIFKNEIAIFFIKNKNKISDFCYPDGFE